MSDESDQAREDAKRQILQDLDDDFTAALGDPAHDIVERVRNGTLTRAKAEDWAREQGRPPFTGTPDPATFEPREKRYWTLAQMAAWALWRTDDAVRAVSEEYVSRCVEWVEAKRARVRFVSPSEFEFTSPTDRVGYELGSPKVATAHDVIENARHRVLLGSGSAPVLSPERAAREILDALQAGTPVMARHGEGLPIDRHLWDGLSPFDSGDDAHDAVFYPSGKMVRFHRVRVERDAVMAVWPALDAAAPIAVEAATVELPEADTGSSPQDVQALEPMGTAGDDLPEAHRPQAAPPVKTKRSTEAGRAVNAKKRNIRKAQRLADIEQLVIEDPEITVDECMRRIKEKCGGRFPASKTTVQPELKAAKDRLAEKK